jgi:hypothetical protein
MGDKWLETKQRESFIGDAEENKEHRLVRQITVLSELEMKNYKKYNSISNKFFFPENVGRV